MATPTPQSDDWDESQLLDNLRKLDELHRRLINLRTVIPTILYPLHAQYSTPTDLFHDFASRAASCSDDIAKFTTMYVHSSNILSHAERSREKNRDGILRLKGKDMFLPDEEVVVAAVLPPPLPSNANEEVKKEKEKAAGENEKQHQELTLYEKQLRASFPETVETEVESVVGEVKGMNGIEIVDVALSGKAEVRAWVVRLPQPVGLEVRVEREARGRWSIVGVRGVRGGEQSPTQVAIAGALERGVKVLERSGKFVLEMVTAYRTLYTEKCAKCGKIVKGGGAGTVNMPVVRKWEMEGWKAFHEDCV